MILLISCTYVDIGKLLFTLGDMTVTTEWYFLHQRCLCLVYVTMSAKMNEVGTIYVNTPSKYLDFCLK